MSGKYEALRRSVGCVVYPCAVCIQRGSIIKSGLAGDPRRNDVSIIRFFRLHRSVLPFGGK